MTFNGLPLHPLIVHLVVVTVPMAAICALLYGVVPRWRWVLRWPLLILAVLGAVATQLAAMSGDDLKRDIHASGHVLALIETHEQWAGRLQFGTWVLAAVAIVAAFTLPVASRLVGGADFAGRVALLKPVLAVVLPVLGLVELYLIFRTGDAGAKAVWSGIGS